MELDLLYEEVELGVKVKDTITGFEGTVTARCQYMNGCVQYEITPTTLKEGVPQKEIWLDEQRVVPVEKKEKTNRSPRRVRRTGGPQNHPEKSPPPSSGGYGEE